MDVSAFQSEFDVSRETLARLTAYEALLRKWQQKINLVGPSTVDQIWQRHFADSLQLMPLIPENAQKWVDLGSGAGFPGAVAALAGFPGEVYLIESDKRKAAFLQAVARETGRAITVLAERIENVAASRKIAADVISARALAPLVKLLEFSAPFVTPKSCALFLKGRDWQAELAAAERDWLFQAEIFPSRTDTDARVIKLTHITSRAKEKI
jgi:16S rRNA (guanine527-N7)-methyltransferase